MTGTATTTLAARAGGFAHVRAGDLVRVVDLDGGQVADLWAFAADDVSEHLSAQHTRAALDRMFPTVGQAFHTNRRRPVLTLERDDSPGVHDMLIASCDPERYAGLGCAPDHASCATNLAAALVDAGVGDIGFTPQSVNLFMAIPWDAAGNLAWEPATTKPGDSVALRAQIDTLVVVSACPQDVVPINNLDPTRIAVEVTPAG